MTDAPKSTQQLVKEMLETMRTERAERVEDTNIYEKTYTFVYTIKANAQGHQDFLDYMGEPKEVSEGA